MTCHEGRPQDPDGHQAAQQPATCPEGKGGQQHPGLADRGMIARAPCQPQASCHSLSGLISFQKNLFFKKLSVQAVNSKMNSSILTNGKAIEIKI